MKMIKQLKWRVLDKLLIGYSYSIKLCQIIKKLEPRFFRYFIFIVCSPYIFLRWLLLPLYEYTIGRKNVMKLIEDEKCQNFNYNIAVVAIVKNEGAYLKEWIEYHKLVGVDIFYIYDNGSTDNTRDVIRDYISTGVVVCKDFPGKKVQSAAYNDAIKNYGKLCKYMAFIDLDEFIVSSDERPLFDVFSEIIGKVPNACGIGVNWAMYGSSGYEKKQEGLVIETFLRRGVETAWPNQHVKTICNPRMVKDFVSPHFPIYKLGGWSVTADGRRQRLWFNRKVDYSVLRCHHYFCKSKEEFIVKQARGRLHTGGALRFYTI